jgi:hypothetical protein
MYEIFGLDLPEKIQWDFTKNLPSAPIHIVLSIHLMLSVPATTHRFSFRKTQNRNMFRSPPTPCVIKIPSSNGLAYGCALTSERYRSVVSTGIGDWEKTPGILFAVFRPFSSRQYRHEPKLG